MNDPLATLLQLINEILTAAIVVVAASMLLYNLTRNLRNRVARTSAIVLACVTIVYLGDVFIALGPGRQTMENVMRMQWIGIALMPAAMFHLSDALLATTGLPSRGRRRRVTQRLYAIGAAFMVAAAFTDILIKPIVRGNSSFVQSGYLFPVYCLFFLLGTGIALVNVQRARQRCLTRDTRRRMGYLQVAMLTPPFGIFPYSVLLGIGEGASVPMLVLVNITNFVIILMLLFLAYPLSFFGTQVPDRVVKTDLLRFMLRGPATGLLALVVIIVTTQATAILGLRGDSFMPFAVVAVVLLWQWGVALALPWLEKRLIYSGEDDDQLAKLQRLSDRLLTRFDLLQLLDAILAASCDYLQVNTAFILGMADHKPELIAAVGPARPSPTWLEDEQNSLRELAHQSSSGDDLTICQWHSFWIVPLYSKRNIESDGAPSLIGFLGVQARSQHIDLTAEEQNTLHRWIRRAAETLDNMALQTEIYASLEGLLPQISLTRTRSADVEYRPGREARTAPENGTVDREQFVEQVRAALRHYWGGPGLTSSRLLELNLVKNLLPENNENPARALRAALLMAIEKQRPEGDRKLASPEWTIYNILEQRFVENNKVREVARRLVLSEADFYRKQRIAIEAVADTLIEMEEQFITKSRQ